MEFSKNCTPKSSKLKHLSMKTHGDLAPPWLEKPPSLSCEHHQSLRAASPVSASKKPSSELFEFHQTLNLGGVQQRSYTIIAGSFMESPMLGWSGGIFHTPTNGYHWRYIIWANYNNSLTWIKAIWGSFHLLTMIIVRSQWGRYNLPRYYI